jgi:glycosyltransferase involved in cell wall biosynthesis
MKILMVLEREFPFDERVEKEALSLAEAGHEVHIASYTFGTLPSFSEYNGIMVYRKKISKLVYKLSTAALLIPVYFLFWKRFLRKLIRNNNYNAIHVHDLPLTRVAWKLSRKSKCLLVCDQHEYYSNWIVHTEHMNRGAGKIIKWLSNWSGYEKKFLARADRVITVSDQLREMYIVKGIVNASGIISIPNTPSKKIFNAQNLNMEIVKRYQDRKVIFYAGGIDILRGIDVVVKALPSIAKSFPEILLVLAGPLRGTYNPMKLAEELGIDHLVEHIDWVDISDIPTYIHLSRMGFFTPPANREEINRTIATKIYQYLVMGRPVIVGQAEMMREFVETLGIGLVIDENDPEDFAEKAIALLLDKSLYESLCSNCLKAAGNYYWESTVQPLVQYYQTH